MSGRARDAVIRDYQRKGYRRKCYGDLRIEEKITKDEDYQCYAVIKSLRLAFDRFPVLRAPFPSS